MNRPAVILLVEDDPADTELTRRALKASGSPARLFVTTDGEDALAYLQHEGDYRDEETAPTPDLVLLDLNMPRLDGRELLRRMRSLPELRLIPAVALTTSDSPVDIAKVYELGANSYITKPRSMSDYVEVFRALESYWFNVVSLPSMA